jgi:hypothetical protein
MKIRNQFTTNYVSLCVMAGLTLDNIAYYSVNNASVKYGHFCSAFQKLTEKTQTSSRATTTYPCNEQRSKARMPGVIVVQHPCAGQRHLRGVFQQSHQRARASKVF